MNESNLPEYPRRFSYTPNDHIQSKSIFIRDIPNDYSRHEIYNKLMEFKLLKSNLRQMIISREYNRMSGKFKNIIYMTFKEESQCPYHIKLLKKAHWFYEDWSIDNNFVYQSAKRVSFNCLYCSNWLLF